MDFLAHFCCVGTVFTATYITFLKLLSVTIAVVCRRNNLLAKLYGKFGDREDFGGFRNDLKKTAEKNVRLRDEKFEYIRQLIEIER